MCAGFTKNRMIHEMCDIKLSLMIDDFLQVDKKKSHLSRCLLTKAYEEEVPIAVAKYNDLKVCNDLTMPIKHNTFYKSLKRSATVPNVLPKPHMEKTLIYYMCFFKTAQIYSDFSICMFKSIQKINNVKKCYVLRHQKLYNHYVF